MAIVCSSCDVAPAPSAHPNTPCPACGERLILFDTTDKLVGTTIDGRFEVLAPLGQGGMGIVYRAKQLSIGREIALKVLDRRIEKDVKSVQRFFREAKLASRLQHPNTVTIIDFGQHTDGRVFLAMELINGRTLLQTLNDEGALPLARVAEIGAQLCDALEAAHDLHIVHRDLKLENAMLLATKRDHVKILDFGLARSLVDPSTQMTATGLVSGTPRYMAPEVGIDAAAPAPSQDMYSLGVMLAESAIGRPLWDAPTIELLFTKKLDTERSITGVPAVLKPVIRALLAQDPAARPTAAETRKLLRELEVVGSRSAIAPAPTEQIRIEVSTSAMTPDPFASLETVALDELPQAPRNDALIPARMAPDATLLSGPPPGMEVEPDPRFSSPEADQLRPELQIDRAYLAERASKLAARQAPVVVVKKTSRLPAGILSILLLGGLGGGGYAYYHFVHRKQPVARIEGPGITITIEATGNPELEIDGKPAGKAPIRLQLPRSSTPMLITSPKLRPLQVIPDRDQTVTLER